MPYLKGREPKFAKVARLIKGYATPPKVAEMIGCSANTARKKMNDPQQFTLGELNLICRSAHIPVEEMRQAAQV
nr:MAG TPA: LAMBDA REPRESSOR (TRIPLE MUTANT)/DNA COMPLEX-DNA COMPLEX, DOUBLE HELIX, TRANSCRIPTION-DNA.1A [Caudoviricetes sp.]